VGTLGLRLLLIVLILSLAQPAAAAGAVSALDQAAVAIDEARYQDALNLIDQATGALSNDADRDWTSYLKARALVGLGRGEAAEAAVRARFKAKPSAYAWASVVSILTAQGHFEDAAGEILKLDGAVFSYANRLRPRTIDDIISALERKGVNELRDQLVTRLVTDKYSGPTATRVPDSLRMRYVGLLLKQAHVEDAARETEAIETPALLAALLADRSYSALWDHPSMSALLAPEALIARVERSVQLRLEQKVISTADWLDTMHALRAIGRPKETVRLGLHAISEARNESRESGAALRLELGYAYIESGEAWAARRTARELLREEARSDAATQIAVAQLLIAAGDNEGALAIASSVQEDSDDDGAVSANAGGVEACAAHNLGRLDRRDEALADVMKLQKEAPEAVFGALLCTGHTNEAVAALSAMLQAPETRPQAVLIAQLYADPLDPQVDLRDMRYRLRALAASDAVQAALKPYGRTIALPFLSSTAGIY
jgi:tetratricopeptide (TPR) repeat protein